MAFGRRQVPQEEGTSFSISGIVPLRRMIGLAKKFAPRNESTLVALGKKWGGRCAALPTTSAMRLNRYELVIDELFSFEVGALPAFAKATAGAHATPLLSFFYKYW